MQSLEEVEAKLNEQRARGKEALEGLFLRFVQSCVRVCETLEREEQQKPEDGDGGQAGGLLLALAVGKPPSFQ